MIPSFFVLFYFANSHHLYYEVNNICFFYLFLHNFYLFAMVSFSYYSPFAMLSLILNCLFYTSFIISLFSLGFPVLKLNMSDSSITSLYEGQVFPIKYELF